MRIINTIETIIMLILDVIKVHRTCRLKSGNGRGKINPTIWGLQYKNDERILMVKCNLVNIGYVRQDAESQEQKEKREWRCN